jgi:hypothetical protein
MSYDRRLVHNPMGVATLGKCLTPCGMGTNSNKKVEQLPWYGTTAMSHIQPCTIRQWGTIIVMLRALRPMVECPHALMHQPLFTSTTLEDRAPRQTSFR